MPPTTLSPDVASAFAERVARSASEHRLPSVIAGIVAGGRVVHWVTAGSDSRRVTPATAFRIASMTKSFTATAVLSLRDGGALALDDPVARWVPELADLRLPTTDSAPITIRQLLSMSTGLATDDPWADRHLADTEAEMDAWFRAGGTFGYAPGTAYEYSNYGYAMLGRVITDAAGLDFGSYIASRLLQPLGMARSGWTAPGDDVAPGFRLLDGEVVLDDPPLGHGGFASMGGLWSTLDDLARWVGFLSDAFPARDEPDDGPVRRSSRRELQQVHRAYRTPALHHGTDGVLHQIGLGYGMGVQRMHHLAHGAMVAHSGGLPGYGSNMRWFPELDFGVVALANLTYAPMYELTQQLIDLLGDADAIPSAPPRPVKPALRSAVDSLVALINDWNDEAAAALFADNVALDEPLALRRRTALEHVAGGPLRVDRIDAVSATEADVTLVAPDGSTGTLELQLSPTVPPLVQWYEFSEHHRTLHDE